ncbi:MAG: amidohydrolase [Bacillota bacterium]|nr:amidohydrolase [Bacillota bacterium]
MSTLFKNCRILTRNNGKYNEIKNGFLGVDKEVIDYISDVAPQKQYDEVKDMKGKLLMPGLVNTHGHSAMTLVRGAGSGLPLDKWLNDIIFPIEARMTPEDIYNGDKIAIMEMLASGTTQVTDMYDFPYAGLLSYADTGMKVNICRVGLCFDPALEAKDWPRTAECIDLIRCVKTGKNFNAELEREIKETDLDLIKKAVDADRVKADLCLHSEYLTTPKFVDAIVLANKELGARIHMHISETAKEQKDCMDRHEGKTPIQYFNEKGVFDFPVYAAHCVWLTDEDMDIIKDKDFTIVHNPTSNLKLGSGIARIADALDAGINVALGTDGVASNNNLNMFEEMHLAALLQKGEFHNPTLISDAQVIDMATVNGAKALGRPDTGSLEVGKKADIIAIDMEKMHLIPNEDTLALITFAMQGSDVCMTMVDGKILYENGEFTTIDKEKVLYEFNKSVDRLNGR